MNNFSGIALSQKQPDDADSSELMGVLNFVRYNTVIHTAFHKGIPQFPKTLWNKTDCIGILYNPLKMVEWMSAQ
jgi:hypothetical protein